MNTLKLIVEREYADRVRKKTFILMTILMPFLFVALALLPLWLANLKDSGTKKNRRGGLYRNICFGIPIKRGIQFRAHSSK